MMVMASQRKLFGRQLQPPCILISGVHLIGACSSQGRVVVLVHLQVLLLLLVADGLGGRAVLIVVIVLRLEFVASLLVRPEAATAPTATTPATTSVATSATTAPAPAGRLVIVLGLSGLHLLVEDLFLLLGLLLHLFNLLLQLGAAILTEPALLLLYLPDAIVQIVVGDRRRDAQHRELLDDDQVKLERLLVLHRLLLLLSLLFTGTANGHRGSGLPLLLGLGDLDLALGDLLVDLLLDSLPLELRLGLSGRLLVVDNEPGSHLQGVQIADQVLAAIQLFLVRMRQILDCLFAFFFALLLVSLVLHDLVLLSLHPIDMLDFVLLHFEIVALLPVFLTLLVFEGVERRELLLDRVDLLGDLVGLSLGLVFLSICKFELFSHHIYLLVETVFLLLDTLYLRPYLLLLSNQHFDFILQNLISFRFWN